MATTETTNAPTASNAVERRGGQLETERGTTTIADGVVAKVVGLAAREVAGVHDMGGVTGRTIGRAASRVGVADERTRGVNVEVGAKEAAADLTVVIDYGESIPRVSEAIRENVIRRVEGICGLTVKEVNVSVNDLYFADEDDDAGADEPARVE